MYAENMDTQKNFEGSIVQTVKEANQGKLDSIFSKCFIGDETFK